MLSLVGARSIQWFRTVLPVRYSVVTGGQTYDTQPTEEALGRHVNSGPPKVGSSFVCRTHVGSFRGYCTAHTKLSCWKCQQTLEDQPTFFCPLCKVVQPADESASHFQILNSPHSFTLDTQKLQKTYLQLQRTLHPDNFSQNTKEEQQHSEDQSALLNKAYRTLLKPLSRGLYMLELEGMALEEGSDSGADPSFLMELMELNEAVEDAQTPEEADRIGRDTKVKLEELTDQIDGALNRGEHEAAKALLIRMKYFATVEEKVKEQLSKLM
ncbi:iron-sulfur cluster co-chaperone protein HscB isoform X2 [Gadus macrocephalus]|uniref:iron-sulfur cluster co-chaperone protein HscB isoform X2 n=1 Tax=Gadus macrocephalus TaxID=80720 RepID=UPI0028CB23C6|nr:iron-sulfur cluster co-chaperone protein HscB isoform X2 [Gadus macrocephalus]